MEEFLNNLYSYEYFGIYLIISIVVLILLFFIILFFGKKDQKVREIEATKKLQQINADAFKDDSISSSVEVNNNLIQENNIENIVQETNNIEQNGLTQESPEVVPTIDDVPSIMNNIETDSEIPEPVLPIVEENNITLNNVEEVETPVIEPITEVNIEPVVENNLIQEDITPIIETSEVKEEATPLLNKIEEKPLIFNDTIIEEKPVVPTIEQVQTEEPAIEEKEEIEVPKFNFDEIVKSVEETKKTETNYNRGPQIFSSVYVPEKEVKEPVIETPVVEMPEVKENNNINDEMDFELPSLKKDVTTEEPEVKEEKIEMPVLNDYNLDNLSGETYDIK